MFEGTLFPRTVSVSGLGALRRGWFVAPGGRWAGSVPGPDGPVALRLPGNAERPDVAAADAARKVLADDLGTARDALEVAFIESETGESLTGCLRQRPSGEVRWVGLDVWPYGHEKGGAMARFEVPWDPEHVWGVWLDAMGRVIDVVVSPGP